MLRICLGRGQLLVSPGKAVCLNGREQDESAVSRTIWAAPALTTRKRRDSVSGLGHPVVERDLLPWFVLILYPARAVLNITFGHVSKSRAIERPDLLSVKDAIKGTGTVDAD
jgi:hypothetical protein